MMKENWVKRKIEDICEKASSNIAQNKLIGIDGIYPVFGASGFVQNVDFYHRDSAYIGIVKDGSGVGRVNIYPAKSSLLGTMQYIIPKKEMSISFVAYALKKLNLSSFASGATIPHIYFKDYGKCEISVPPLAEQEKIVGELDLLSGVIEKQKAQLKELDTLAQSIFYDMFGDPVENPKGWETHLLKNIGKVVTGNTPSRLNEEFYNEKYIEWIKSDNLSNDFLYASKAKEHLSKTGAEKGRIIPEQSILVTCIAGSLSTIGTASCVNRQVAFNQQINAIVPNTEMVTSLFLLSLIRNIGSIIRENASNGMKHMISKSVFEKIIIPVPPLALQQEFADKIAAIENQKFLISASLADSQKLLDSSMDKYFG